MSVRLPPRIRGACRTLGVDSENAPRRGQFLPDSPPTIPTSDRLPAKTPVAATPIAFVRAIALAYAQRGLSPAQALAQAQIAPELLQRDDARITALQMERISEAAMRELDDEALGWFGRRLPWGSYGMLARASNGAASLGVALRRWCRHHGLLTDDIALALQADGPVATLGITETGRGITPALREFCLVSVLRNVHGLACWYIDSRIPLLGAQFTFAAPPHADAYAVLFPGPVAFGAERTALHFDARYLAAIPARPPARAARAPTARRARPPANIATNFGASEPARRRAHEPVAATAAHAQRRIARRAAAPLAAHAAPPAQGRRRDAARAQRRGAPRPCARAAAPQPPLHQTSRRRRGLCE